MAEVPSTRTLTPGSPAPDFDLPDAHAKRFKLSDVRGERGLVVAFVCNHCPFVVHLARQFAVFAGVAVEQGFGVVAINSNDVRRYPQDSPEQMSLSKGYFKMNKTTRLTNPKYQMNLAH